MANEQNLRPLKLTHEEAVKYGSMGGKASAEARRAKKTMRQYAELLLSLPVADKRKANKLLRSCVPEEDCDNKMLVVFGLVQAAQGGDVAAVKELRNIIGEDAISGGNGSEDDGLIQALSTGAVEDWGREDD